MGSYYFVKFLFQGCVYVCRGGHVYIGHDINCILLGVLVKTSLANTGTDDKVRIWGAGRSFPTTLQPPHKVVFFGVFVRGRFGVKDNRI